MYPLKEILTYGENMMNGIFDRLEYRNEVLRSNTFVFGNANGTNVKTIIPLLSVGDTIISRNTFFLNSLWKQHSINKDCIIIEQH